jgi:hypothetical protein
MTALEQFVYDLNDWLERRGENILCSRKMIERCHPRLRAYWRDWLAGQRKADGLPINVSFSGPDAA